MAGNTASPGVVRITRQTLASALIVAIVVLLGLWQGRGLTLSSAFLVSIITFFFTAVLVGTVLSILSPLLLKSSHER